MPGIPDASPRSYGVPRRDVPGRVHVGIAHRRLGGRGEQAVPGHANTLTGTTDISGEVKRRFPGLKAGVSTPRSS
jgi:hypothetical protein